MKNFLALIALPLLTLHCADSEGQNPFVGRFLGEVNGDPVVMTLEPAGPGKMKGSMTDQHQTYVIEAGIEGQHIRGTATEKTYDLVLGFQGMLDGNRLPLTMEIQGMGNVSFQVELLREGTLATIQKTPASESATAPRKEKQDAHTRDPQVVGTWVHEEIYNSGYGDNFMGSMISSSITFAADGRMIEGESGATMSGSDYYGESGGGGGELEGIRWFTRNQEIWLIVSRDGQTQEVKLGRYAFGGGAMRITADNGEKLLLQRR